MSTPTSSPATPRPSARGRRRAATPSIPWLPAVALLVTVVALLLAGLAGAPVARSGAGAVAVGRTFACPGGLPGTRATGGSATAGGARSRHVGTDPRIVEIPAARAAQGYAVQDAGPRGRFAMAPCPEPRSRWWFTGLGAARPHTSRVVLANPRDADALVDVDVLGPGGPVDLPDLRGLEVRHGETKVLDLAELAPVRGELAVRVTATRGLVAAVAADSYASGVLANPVQEWVPGTERPSRHVVLTGLPDRADDATVLVANPGQVETLVSLRVAGRRGTFTVPGREEIRVPPGAVVRADVAKAFDGHPTALRVDGESPVVASLRVSAGGDLGYADSGRPLRRTSALGVPGGATAQVRLTATDSATRVGVTGYDARGRTTGSRTVAVAAGATVKVALGRETRAVVVEPGDAPVVAGLVAEAGRGFAGAAFPMAGATSRAPVARPE